MCAGAGARWCAALLQLTRCVLKVAGDAMVLLGCWGREWRERATPHRTIHITPACPTNQAQSLRGLQVLVATSKGHLLRYHWDEYGNERGEQQRA